MDRLEDGHCHADGDMVDFTVAVRFRVPARRCLNSNMCFY